MHILLTSHVCELIDPHLPALSAQVVLLDHLEVLCEDGEPPGVLLGVGVHLVEVLLVQVELVAHVVVLLVHGGGGHGRQGQQQEDLESRYLPLKKLNSTFLFSSVMLVHLHDQGCLFSLSWCPGEQCLELASKWAFKRFSIS